MIGGGEQITRCDHVLLALFNHQTHHRGQVPPLLPQLGADVGVTAIPVMPGWQ